MTKGASGHTAQDPTFKSLKPAMFLMLAVLADGDCHAYALKKEVARRSEGRVTLGPATVHRYLNKLTEEGWIGQVESPLPTLLDDERRRYYSLTPEGRAGLAAIAETQLRLAQEVQLSLASKGAGQ